MPWMIVSKDGMHCVHKKNPDGTAGKQMHCYNNEKEAGDYMKALYAHMHDNGASVLQNVRYEMLDGERYIIAPSVPVREKVLNGSLLPASEIEKFHMAWNGTPITLRHPKQNNGSVNVPNPDVPIIGKFFQAAFDGNRLTGEYWLNEKLLLAHSPETHRKIVSGQPVETSTGYWSDEEEANGTFQNADYEVIQRNIRPDHIAILPEEIGACSIEDGCGVNRNAKTNMFFNGASHPWHKGRPGEVGGSMSDGSGAKTEAPTRAKASTAKADAATKKALASGNPKDHAAARDAHLEAARDNMTAYRELEKESPQAATSYKRMVMEHEGAADIHNRRSGTHKNATMMDDCPMEDCPMKKGKTKMNFSELLKKLGITERVKINVDDGVEPSFEIETPAEPPIFEPKPIASASLFSTEEITALKALAKAAPVIQNAAETIANESQIRKNSLIASIKSNPANPFGDAELNSMTEPALMKMNAHLNTNFAALGEVIANEDKLIAIAPDTFNWAVINPKGDK